MPFYASEFQYENIASSTYNLYISQIDGDGGSTDMGSSPMEIYNQKLYRRSQPYFYGSTPSENLSMEVSISSPDNIDSETSQLISKWLFSNRSYKKLMIIQPDMEGVYLNCMFNKPQIERVGNFIQGYTATLEADAPYAWRFPRTKTYTYTSPVIDASVVFNNKSDDKGAYLYPKLVITMNNSGGNVTITNSSDASRVFSFTGLLTSEVITIDNSLQQITSSTGLLRMSNFNKKFFRLIPEINNLRFQGNIASIDMTYQFVAKI
jgi:phage-related protein